MHDRLFDANETFESTTNKMIPRLDEYLNGDVIGNAVLIDQSSQEVELGISSRWEAYLDLFEADANEFLEEANLFIDAHGNW